MSAWWFGFERGQDDVVDHASVGFIDAVGVVGGEEVDDQALDGGQHDSCAGFGDVWGHPDRFHPQLGVAG